MFVCTSEALSPVRIFEDFTGKSIKEATFSSPVRIIGWNELPAVGTEFVTVLNKKQAETYIASKKSATDTSSKQETFADDQAIIPVILKASEAGGLDAVSYEVSKISHEKLKLKIISATVGDITEGDIKLAGGLPGTILLGFNVKIDAPAKAAAEKTAVEVKLFDIIYKLSEWLQETVTTRAPKIMVEESVGKAKIVRLFSKVKDRQVIGGKVETGILLNGSEVRITRRDFEIGKGKIRELQRQKSKVGEVPEGQEFGALVESKIEIAPGDRIEAFTIVEK